MTQTTVVDVYVDPGCPYAWQTSRWLLEVSAVRSLDLRWHPLSLAALNDGPDLPEEWRGFIALGWRYSRVLAAAADADPASVGPLYRALGERIHHGKRIEQADEVLAESLAEAGLPSALVAAADDPSLDDLVRAQHAVAMAAYGEDMGTPLVSIDGVCWFGPVFAELPEGDDAVALWDALQVLARIPGFYEIKRRRTAGPSFD